MVRRFGRWTALLTTTFLLPVPTARADGDPPSEIVASKGSKVYHTRACSSSTKLNRNTALRFKSEEEAQATGRRICKVCADQIAREPKGAAPPAPPMDGEAVKPAPPAATSQPAEPAAVVPVTATIKKVLPGGTLVSETGETFGLIGIECPQAEQPLVKETVRFIREQTRGRKVRIRAESGGARRDSLGRLQVYLFAQPGERDLGDELLFQGLAWMDRGETFERFDRYLKQEYEGWWNRRGVWKMEEGNSGNCQVMIGRHAWNYHAPDCPHAPQLAQPQTVKLNDAKAMRLSPCAFYRSSANGSATASSAAKSGGEP